MRLRPHRYLLGITIALAAIVLLLLVAGVPVGTASSITAVAIALITTFALFDAWYSRRELRVANLQLARELPAALALGVRRAIRLQFTLDGRRNWRCRVFDHSDPVLVTQQMPAELTLAGSKITELSYDVTPGHRGEARFEPADLFVTSIFRLWELRLRCGPAQSVRVYPDFAQVARYAWLAGDRRLAEIGIKSYQQRGEGTDFKQLSEYRIGDPIRHIDWKATLRTGKPIVRQFQNERDQAVLLLIDCGRRMRADESEQGVGSSHFDQVLNATMLLTYVALKQGDAVGALTFGAPAGEERWFPPRKGAHVLNALMSELYDVQPTPTYSDYLVLAQDVLRRQSKRALVIVITNFRDEDASEMSQALRLLRSRHLVLTASLRERVVDELASQPLAGDAAIEVASAHLYEQSRRDAFNRLAARDALMIDAEPQRLGIALVNRYQAVKRAGLL